MYTGGGAPPYGSAQPQPSASQPTYGEHGAAAKQGRIEGAFNLFMKNLGLILPPVLLFIAEVIIGGVIVGVVLATYFGAMAAAGAGVLTSLFVFGGVLGAVAAFLVAVLTGIFVSILTAEARSAVLGQSYTIGAAWREVRSRLSDVVFLAVIMAVVYAVLHFVPFVGWLLDALTLTYFITAYALLFARNSSASNALGESLNWLSRMGNTDALALVVFIVASLLSAVPILNFFTLPYEVILVLQFIYESAPQFPPAASTMPPPPPPTAPNPTFQADRLTLAP
jgi:type III secretory pathway component EscV